MWNKNINYWLNHCNIARGLLFFGAPCRSGSVTTWMGDTTDCFYWTLVVGWPATSLACACSVHIVDFRQHVHLIGCGDQRAGVQTVRQNITKIVSDQDAVLPLARVKGYVWHWYNAIFKTIAGAAVLILPNLSLWVDTCDSRLTCITWCLYTVLCGSKESSPRWNRGSIALMAENLSVRLAG